MLSDSNGPQPHSNNPFVLSTSLQNGEVLTAVNAAASELGLHKAMPLTDARAICPSVKVTPADLEGDDKALHQLALWCQCYSPFVRADLPEGLTIDITGCAHLFGGEVTLLKELEARLRRFGLTAKLATAPTIGAAWATARHVADKRPIITPETLHNTLAPIPISALRLGKPTVEALAKVGLKQIRDLLGKPRAPLVARFGSQLIERLDQAFDKHDESFCALTPPPPYRTEQRFAEPIMTLPAIEEVIRHLSHNLSAALNKAGKGARKLELTFFRVDGWPETLSIQTSALALSRDAGHLLRLLCEHLDKLKDHAGFGFEVATLNAFDVETITPHQEGFKNSDERRKNGGDLSRLLDRFINRFGPGNVTRFAPYASYIPERAMRAVPVLQNNSRHNWVEHAHALQGDVHFGRPFLLFPSPEPITTLSEVPDGPPLRFEWNRISHRITRADGPERIAPEWWTKIGENCHQTRDYYRVEDEEGRRFWLYRDGLYEHEGKPPCWFIHGIFS